MSITTHLPFFYDEDELTVGRTPVLHLIQTHIPAHEKDFLPIITRETPDLLPKPDPAGILHIAQAWKVGARAEHLIMVFNAYLPAYDK